MNAITDIFKEKQKLKINQYRLISVFYSFFFQSVEIQYETERKKKLCIKIHKKYSKRG